MRQFQICFLPLHFDRLLFVYLLLFMHQAMCNIIKLNIYQILERVRVVYSDAWSS